MSERMSDERFKMLNESWALGNSPFAPWPEFVAERAEVERLDKRNAELEAQLANALLLADRRLAYLQTHVWKSGKALNQENSDE